MKAFILYERVQHFNLGWKPYASSGYCDLSPHIDWVVLADSAEKAAEALGLGQYYVEERYNQPGDNRWRGLTTPTIQIPFAAMTQMTTDHPGWDGRFRHHDPQDWLGFDHKQSGLHLVVNKYRSINGEKKVIFQLDEVPLLEPALVPA